MLNTLRIKKNRIIVYDDEIDNTIDIRSYVKKGRHFKNMDPPGWSFPIDEMSSVLSFLSLQTQKPLYELETEWYEIFPKFKFLLSNK